MERTITIDHDLARRADRKVRRYGMSLDDVVEWTFSLIVNNRGLPDFASPISLNFSVDGRPVRKRPGVLLPIAIETVDGLHTARIDSIGLDVFTESCAELADEVRRQLVMLWKEYALADDSELTESACKIKRNLLASFEEVRHANGRAAP